jgi:hypothetical protein
MALDGGHCMMCTASTYFWDTTPGSVVLACYHIAFGASISLFFEALKCYDLSRCLSSQSESFAACPSALAVLVQQERRLLA